MPLVSQKYQLVQTLLFVYFLAFLASVSLVYEGAFGGWDFFWVNLGLIAMLSIGTWVGWPSKFVCHRVNWTSNAVALVLLLCGLGIMFILSNWLEPIR